MPERSGFGRQRATAAVSMSQRALKTTPGDLAWHPPGSERPREPKHRPLGLWLFGAGVLVVALMAEGTWLYHTHWWAGPYRSPVTLDVGSSCPATLGRKRGVSASGISSWFHKVASGGPKAALVCQYETSTPNPSLIHQLSLGGDGAQKLATAARAGSTVRPGGDEPCILPKRPDTVVAFSYPNGATADIWEEGGGCGFLTNGRLRASSFAAFNDLVTSDLHGPS